MAILWYLFTYLLGGITLLPLVAAAVYYWFDQIFPPPVEDAESYEKSIQELLSDQDSMYSTGSGESNYAAGPIDSGNDTPGDGYKGSASKDMLSILEEELDTGVDVYMSGWMTVSREYFIYPSGGPNNTLNPPHPASNDESMTQNQSAYSSLYKLMSNSSSGNSGKSTPKDSVSTASNSSAAVSSSTSSSLSSSNNSSTSSKKKKSIKFFAVLRHGNLFLYNNTEETDVKHVIVLAHHYVIIWPPNVLDGELFIKRSAICLVPRKLLDKNGGSFNIEFLSNPNYPPRNSFFLYTDNCSEKEDFYFALIRASKRSPWTRRPSSLNADKPSTNNDGQNLYSTDPTIMAHPLYFKTYEAMDLIQTLHSTDANLQTRWLNALLGRLFLAVKDTKEFENFFRHRIVKKLSRVKRPGFLSDIVVKKISGGHSIPYFTNPKLKEFTPEGSVTISTDMAYSGDFTLEITTTATLNLGSRFKPRTVSLLLRIVLKRIEGQMVFKIKPPPSNRIWYAFESMPKVSSKMANRRFPHIHAIHSNIS